jgi:hypothetical protein
MGSFGKLFISIGLIMIIIGGIFLLGEKFGLGKLPGDIFIQKGNFTFFFPIVSTLIISLILTLILNLFKR